MPGENLEEMTETTAASGPPAPRGGVLGGSSAGTASAELPGTTAQPRHDALTRPVRGPAHPSPVEDVPVFGEADVSDSESAPDWERLDPRGWYPLFGRRALTVLLLVVALPLAALLSDPIALINWVIFRDVSRILYHQPRVGYHGRVFSIVKFRTMRETSHDAFDSWKEGHDGLRITRFGRFLRNTHLDELPQLLNILRGEMDFIGPRPEMIEIHLWACENVPRFRSRHALLPGITGYAQITQGYAGMDELAYARKLAADLDYMERMSLRLDLEILFRTAVWMLRGRGWRWKSKPVPVVE